MSTGSLRGWLCARFPAKLALPGMVVILQLVPSVGAQTPAYVPCIDTLAVNSTAVSVVVITDLCTPTTCGRGSNVIVNMEEQLKGSSGPARSAVSRVSFSIDAPAATLAGWKAGANRLLVFDHVRNGPLSSTESQKVIDLSAHGLKALTADMRVLFDPEQIIEGTRRAIGRHPNVYGMLTFSENLSAEAARALGTIAWTVTDVPLDSDLEQRAQSALYSREDGQRAEAARALGHFPSEDNASRLRRLLDDPALSNNGPGNVNIYFVRQAAYASLIGMGVTVLEPVLKKEPERH